MRAPDQGEKIKWLKDHFKLEKSPGLKKSSEKLKQTRSKFRKKSPVFRKSFKTVEDVSPSCPCTRIKGQIRLADRSCRLYPKRQRH